MKYRDYVDALVPLETFDPAAFVGDEQTTQDLCNFVLSLALIYNDFRGVIIGHHAIDGLEPEDTTKPTPELGMFNALRLNMLRLHAGIFRELFDLLAASERTLSHPFFARLCGKLSGDARTGWQSLCDVASARPSDNVDLKALLLVRNKVSFHYDPKAIFRGYKNLFVDAPEMEPLLSRGNRMPGTQFFFADAAAQSYLMEQGTENALVDILTGRSTLVTAINICLYEIVTRFVALRGYGWRQPRG